MTSRCFASLLASATNRSSSNESSTTPLLCRIAWAISGALPSVAEKRKRIGGLLKCQPLLFGGEGENIAELSFLRLLGAHGKFQRVTGFAKIDV